jgi:hypothetical protein
MNVLETILETLRRDITSKQYCTLFQEYLVFWILIQNWGIFITHISLYVQGKRKHLLMWLQSKIIRAWLLQWRSRINMFLNGKGSYLPFREGTTKSFSHGSFVGVVKSPCLLRLTQFQFVMFPAKYWFHVCATSYWLHNLKATLNKGPSSKVQWDQAFLLVKSFKLVPSPLDKGPRRRQFTLWFSLHGILLEGTSIGLDKKKA